MSLRTENLPDVPGLENAVQSNSAPGDTVEVVITSDVPQQPQASRNYPGTAWYSLKHGMKYVNVYIRENEDGSTYFLSFTGWQANAKVIGELKVDTTTRIETETYDAWNPFGYHED